MTEVFISYAHEDAAVAGKVALALQTAGRSVWWDINLRASDLYPAHINRALDEARVGIVIWSQAGLQSNWVLAEAHRIHERGIYLGVVVSPAFAPVPFNIVQNLSFSAGVGPVVAETMKRLSAPDTRTGSPPPIEAASHATSAPFRAPLRPVLFPLPRLLEIPAGSVTIGDDGNDARAEADERPARPVRFTKRFALGEAPVTFEEFDAFCRETGRAYPDDAGWGRGRNPVINVNWFECMDYCAWLSQQSGGAFRLPSEAEWEYACRAGSASPYTFGESISGLAQFDASGADAEWRRDFAPRRTSQVAKFKSNAWGLFDMHGNVSEWCADNWQSDYSDLPDDGRPQPGGDPERACVRGGSWSTGARWLRSRKRNFARKTARANDLGFRVALELANQ